MSDLFGTPLGEIARSESNRAGMLGGLQAQELMGKIAAQPAELQYKRSLGRLHEAEAQGKEAESAAQQQMLNLQLEWSKGETAARAALVAGAESQGQVATVADLKGGSAQAALRPVSQADSLRRFAEFAEKRGVPPLALAKLHKDIADIAQSEAIGAYRTAQAGDIEDKATRAKRQELGGIAAAAAQDPRTYAAIMMDPQARKMLPPQLTGNYTTDAPVLRAIAQSSLDADKQADNARAEQDVASKIARRKSASAASGANVKLTQARLGIAQEVLTNLKKYGGPTAAAALDATRTTSEARQAAAAAAEAKNFPAMPLSEKDILSGQTYTLNGKRYTAAGKNAEGKMTFIPFEEGHARALKAAKAELAAATAAAELDDED